MGNRFKKVTQLTDTYWIQGSPIVLEDAAIFKDINKTENNIFLILKFRNIGRTLSGIDIDINCFDSFGDQVGIIKNYKYVDLNIDIGKTFGGYTQIPLPDNTSTYRVILNRVLLGDGSAHNFKQQSFEPVEKQKNMMNVLADVYQQYLRERGWENKKGSIYYPQDFSSYWRCDCGSVNLAESKSCAACKQGKEIVFKICEAQYQNQLKVNLEEYKAEREKAKLAEQRQLEIERQEEKERQDQEAQIAAKKRKQRTRRIKITSFSLATVAVISILCFILKTPAGYYVALKSFDNSKYNNAAVMFEKLGEYKDSKELWKESVYQQGLEAYNNSKYENSAEAFGKIVGYKDSDELWHECIAKTFDLANIEGWWVNTLNSSQAIKIQNDSIVFWDVTSDKVKIDISDTNIVIYQGTKGTITFVPTGAGGKHLLLEKGDRKTRFSFNPSSHSSASSYSNTNSKAYSSTSSNSSFSNKYGTADTKCAHSGCNNKIASSGDTNCCTTHSKRCLECNCYIDEDAAWCISCLKEAMS